ncbi:MAG: hypothetical protein HKN26_14290 [Acidimicrobiales bacterium]|nr:hypothetical protein [Acidimicrobiales bacterium]
MGKASSAKKVARAARAGQTAGAGAKERRDIGFPLAMAAVVVFGIGLVVFARTTRDVSAAEPTLQDHWHSAYGVYDCRTESFYDWFPSSPGGFGIHSHDDGLIHIHPTSSNATGSGAVLEQFIDNVGGEIEDDLFTMPDGTVLPGTGVQCDGQDAVLQVVRWNSVDSDSPDEVITENLEQTRFQANGEIFTIALAPIGADIPLPPSVGNAPADEPDFSTTTDLVPGSIPGATEAPSTTGIPSATEAPSAPASSEAPESPTTAGAG